MIPSVIAGPVIAAVVIVIAARARARQQGTVFPMSRAALILILGGGVGVVVGVLAYITLQHLTG